MATRYSVVWVYHIHLINPHFMEMRSAVLEQMETGREAGMCIMYEAFSALSGGWILPGVSAGFWEDVMKEGSQQWGDLGRSSRDYPGDSCGKGRRRQEDLKKITANILLPSKGVSCHRRGGNSTWEAWPLRNWATVYVCVAPLWKASVILQNGT